MNNDKITFCSLNCQGLGNFRKRKDVLNYLRDYSILCLQDTHISKEIQNKVKNEWGFEAAFSSFNSQSRGVAIFLNKNLDYKIMNQISDPNGNFLLLDIEILDKKITLGCIYAPNRDDPEFINLIKTYLLDCDNENIILVGDWNLLLNPLQDGWGYKHINNPRARAKLLDMTIELNLIDVWRKQHPNDSIFTWHKKRNNKIIQKGRLDFFLVSQSIYNLITFSDILPGYRSDHSIISLNVQRKEKINRRTF